MRDLKRMRGKTVSIDRRGHPEHQCLPEKARSHESGRKPRTRGHKKTKHPLGYDRKKQEASRGGKKGRTHASAIRVV